MSLGSHDAAVRHGRFSGLDGLRAISIGLVLVEHLFGTRGFPVSIEMAQRLHLSSIGRLGVQVFFVISGFLITTLLFREADQTGTIRLTRFYFRRSLRIFPAYYLLVAIVAVLSTLGLMELLEGDLFHAWTYTTNYHAPRGWWLGHAWSLAVEEQFYLLWPAALVALGRRRALGLAAAIVLAVPVIRSVQFAWIPGSARLIGETFHTVADSLAVGCLLAGVRGWLASSPAWVGFRRSPWSVLAPLIAVAVPVLLNSRPQARHLWGTTLTNLSIAACIDLVLSGAWPRTLRVLEIGWIVRLGAWSYSIYLYQQLFLNPKSPSSGVGFPWNLALALGAAALSYHLVEGPCLRLRERWELRLWPPEAPRVVPSVVPACQHERPKA